MARALQRGDPVDAVHTRTRQDCWTVSSSSGSPGYPVPLADVHHCGRVPRVSASHLLPPALRYADLLFSIVNQAYVDGPTLYEIDQPGIILCLTAKSNMHARCTALALSIEEQMQERYEKIPHAQGRDATVEILRTHLVAVEGIRTWNAYRPPCTKIARLSFAERPAFNESS